MQVKESIEHLLEAHEEHAHGHWLFMPAVLTATVAQLLAIYAVQNEPMRHVLTAAQNSWLQVRAQLPVHTNASTHRSKRPTCHVHCVAMYPV
jgi:hypothetical protein